MLRFGRFSRASWLLHRLVAMPTPGSANRQPPTRHSSLGFPFWNPRELAPLVVLQRKRSGCPGVTGPVPQPVSMSPLTMPLPDGGVKGTAGGTSLCCAKWRPGVRSGGLARLSGADPLPRRPPRCPDGPMRAPGRGALWGPPSPAIRSACPEPRCPRCPAALPAAA